MPDITMCNWDNCPMKDTCYRYKAKADKLWQVYFIDAPIRDLKCEYYWDMEDRNKEIFNDF
jgi:hypothetical protein